MKKFSLFLMFVLLGLGWVQTSHAADITAAPDLLLETNVAVQGKGATGPQYNARHAIAPYAQVVANSTYTFIGVSHPSLDTAHTSIGIAVEALDMTTVPNNASGRAAVFTVNAGETHRVFIVNQGHSTINTNNTAFTDSKTHLITTSDASQYGSIRVTGIGTAPTTSTSAANRPGDYPDANNTLFRFDNVSQLSMWGVVYQASNGAGFALEFIGDMHDSSLAAAATANNGTLPQFGAKHGFSVGFGRGVN